MQENFRIKGKKLYFGFVDLEKAVDRVLVEVIRWAMRKLRVEEWLVSAVMSMYTGTKTVVRTVCGNSKHFEVRYSTEYIVNAAKLHSPFTLRRRIYTKICLSHGRTGLHLIHSMVWPT